MLKAMKKGFGIVVGIYMGLACTAVINGMLCSNLKSKVKETNKEEFETEATE